MGATFLTMVLILTPAVVAAEISFFSDNRGRTGTSITPGDGGVSVQRDSQGNTGITVAPRNSRFSFSRGERGQTGTHIRSGDGATSFFQGSQGTIGTRISPPNSGVSFYRFNAPDGEGVTGTVVTPGAGLLPSRRVVPVLPPAPDRRTLHRSPSTPTPDRTFGHRSAR